MAGLYRNGEGGVVKNDLKALDCYIRAVELGSAEACVGIGISFDTGNGVSVDKKRAALFEQVGALRGDIAARHDIGVSEYNDFGNHEIAIRHWKIAAEAGHQNSLNALRAIYNNDGLGKEFISKEEMDTVYRSGHEAQMEIKTEEREKHLTTAKELGIM
jgi:TPR repeat protein